MNDTLIKVENVSKKFCRGLKKSLWYGMQDIGKELLGSRHGGKGELRPDEFWAVKDVSFEVKRGECWGLIGGNGAGKTTLLRMLNGLLKPDGGRIEMRGRVGALIALGAGFNPILTGRENIYVNAAVLGFGAKEISSRFDEIVEFAEIGEFIDSPVQNYSSGMQVRLGFAVASALKPDVLILDEVLAVGDINFQSKCFKKIGEIVENSAVILVSHYPHHIKRMCDRALLLDRGLMIEEGKPENILITYQHDKLVSPDSLVLLDKNTLRAIISHKKLDLSSGGYLEFDLEIDLAEEIKCDQAYLNLVDVADTAHGQVVLTGINGIFPAGISRYRLKIGPIYLSSGKYSCDLMLYGVGGKKTIAVLRKCLDFYFKGPVNLGPAYYPPSEVLKLK